MERLLLGGVSEFVVVSSLPMELAWVLAVFSPGGRRSHDVTLSLRPGETCPALARGPGKAPTISSAYPKLLPPSRFLS